MGGQLVLKSGRGLAHSMTLRDHGRVRTALASWSAPALWRFGIWQDASRLRTLQRPCSPFRGGVKIVGHLPEAVAKTVMAAAQRTAWPLRRGRQSRPSDRKDDTRSSNRDLVSSGPSSL